MKRAFWVMAVLVFGLSACGVVATSDDELSGYEEASEPAWYRTQLANPEAGQQEADDESVGTHSDAGDSE